VQPCVDDLDARLHIGARPVIGDRTADPSKPEATYGSELVLDDPFPHGFDLAGGLRHLLRVLLFFLSNFRPLLFQVLLFYRFDGESLSGSSYIPLCLCV